MLGGLMMPATMVALPNNNDNNSQPDQHRSPAHHPHAYITYDEVACIATVQFSSTFADTEVISLQYNNIQK